MNRRGNQLNVGLNVESFIFNQESADAFRRKILETIDILLNSADHSKFFNEALISRGLQLVSCTKTSFLIDDEDLILIKESQKTEALKFITSNLDKLRADYAESNNHQISDLVLKKLIPLLVDAWNKGHRDFVHFRVGLPLPTLSQLSVIKKPEVPLIDYDTKNVKNNNKEWSTTKVGIDSVISNTAGNNLSSGETAIGAGLTLTKKDCMDMFVKMCEKSEKSISATDLYKVYSKWCLDKEYEAYTHPSMINALRKTHLSGCEKRDDKSRSKGWNIDVNTF